MPPGTDDFAATHTFKAHDLKISSVIVYRDRAEVKRVVKAVLEAGSNQVVIENISQNADGDSIIVNGRGDAVIHEVQVNDVPTLPDEKSSPKIQELRDQLKSLENEQKSISGRRQIITKRVDMLDRIIGEAGKALVHSDSKEGGQPCINDESFENLSKLFNHHEIVHTEALERAQQMDETLREIDEKIQKLNEEINRTRHSRHHIRNIVVVLESANGGDVELDVSYQVSCASWRPAYEIRVQSSTNELKLSYFGQIQQCSGEDWVDTSLILSTAQPTYGGVIPRLGTLHAEFYKPEPPPVAAVPMPRGGALFGAAYKSASAYMAEPMAMSESVGAFGAAPQMGHAHVDVSDTFMSTMFTIARTTSIPSDSNEHKVTITAVDLKPKMFYESVPSKSTNVFLTASVVNESATPFLAGQASVYLDNSFIAKASIKNVFPGERFNCSLGVDPAVKVEYKPVHKFSEQGGLLARTVSTMNEQKIIIKNAKATSILITIREHIPKSTDDKLKIKLFSPELDTKDSNGKVSRTNAEPSIGARLDANHNLEWSLNMEPNAEEELLVKWSMEYPAGQNVTFRETFSIGNVD